MPDEFKQSRASRELDAVLNEGGETAKAIKDRVHFTGLWKYRTGRGRPGAAHIALLHHLSEGRVAADGWETDSEVAKREGVDEPADADPAPPDRIVDTSESQLPPAGGDPEAA